MYYNEISGVKLSALGMGNMRLPVHEGQGETAIDEEKAQAIIDYAYAHGVNYYDTAYRYHGGESEKFIGRALKKYPRDSFCLASKFPGHMMEKKENGILGFTSGLAGRPDTTADALFHDQLSRCQVDYFDFYLLHNVNESSVTMYYDQEVGIVDYLVKQREAGKIRHLGFSSHGSAQLIDEFLTRYEGVFEFVQIQLNYLDWKLQDAKSKVEVIAKHGLKVVVMEGVRGGRLANLPEAEMEKLKAVRPDDSAARWALRFLQDLPEVAVVLSGMTTIDQIIENVETFAEPNPVSPDERALLMEVADSMLNWVPCTVCRYCTEGCPMELEIPKIIAAYNGLRNGDRMARYNPDSADPSMDPRRCIGCGSCASICPQGIRIPEIMEEFAGMLA